MENLREQIIETTQLARIDEERVDKLANFTENWRQEEPSTIRKVVTAVLTAFGALIIGASFIGFSAVTLGINDALPLFIITGVIFFPSAFFCLSMQQEAVGLTLMIIGLIASGIPASFEFESSSGVVIFLFPVWLTVLAFALLKMRHRGAIFTAIIVSETYTWIFLISQLDNAPVALSITVLLNLLVVLALSLPVKTVPLRLSVRIQPMLLTATTLAATLFAFVLTLEAIYENLSPGERLMLTLYNVLFFAATGAMVWLGKRRNNRKLIWIGGIFWFAFLFYKYYDLLWNLLDKSLVLIDLGLIFIVIGYMIQKKIANEI